jgi:hypothetical protein
MDRVQVSGVPDTFDVERSRPCCRRRPSASRPPARLLDSRREREHALGLIAPRLPDLDIEDWQRQPHHERLRRMCADWGVHGFGSPEGVYLFYALKLVLYVGGWVALMSLRPDVAGLSDIGTWWSSLTAFKVAIVWTMLYELLGLGCGSGPLTFRFFPPVAAPFYFARPGTVRLPPWPRHVPGTRGTTRTWLDVALYLAILTVGFRAVVATDLGPVDVAPLVLLVPLAGLRDKTVFLAARSEHYWVTLVVLLFPESLLAGSKLVQLAIWWGAATSKLNHHFPSVIAVMVSNSPIIRWRRVKRAMYRAYPDDMRPSRAAAALAHGGTAIEYLVPLVLVLSTGGPVTAVALFVMVCFHLYITSNVPLGVPIEWNILFVYSALVLFGVHADVRVWDLEPTLAVLLALGVLAGPVYGSIRPDRVSFLPAMRYYAGNWGTSFWLVRRDAMHRLDELVGVAPPVQRQLARLYDDDTQTALFGKALAFRSMHLHGRALNGLVPRALPAGAALDDYVVNDGEWIAGVALGWNFGDGHLHHEQLLGALQGRLGFAPGQLRCIFVESQPIQRHAHHWRIVDAADGLGAQGHVEVRDLLDLQPWTGVTVSGER